MDNGHVMICSGVRTEKRAAAGVGCIIHKKLENQIHRWKAWSERILQIEMKEENRMKTIIVVYGPNEDDTIENKNNFWEELTLVVEEAKGTLFVLGDFNSRVGTRDGEYNEVLGSNGEIVRNKNGRIMLDFCLLHDLVITNSFFQHKNIHKFTREVKSREEKSIIDYILVNKNNRKIVIDTKVRRGPEIGSDHYVVISTIQEKDQNKVQQNTHTGKESQRETLRTYKLRSKGTAERYQKTIAERIENIESNGNTEEIWNTFKDVILTTTKEICGVSRNKKKKQTRWWTNEIRHQAKTKKQAWKTYLAEQTAEKYDIYKKERKKTKQLVTEAKKEAWKEFGEKMEKNSKENQKLFYRVIKTIRNEEMPQPTHLIQNKKGEIISDRKQIIQRWKEHFQELLNGGAENENDNEQQIIREKETEGVITMDELEEAIHKLKNGKAPGGDKITAEMIKHIGQKGKELMLKIYNKIWMEEEIPNEWRKTLIVPIYKNKGNKRDCNNYRGISLISTAMKILEQIIDKRLRTTLESTLHESQSGFRKGRSTQDPIFSMKQLIQKASSEQKKVYLAFIDLEKAFDKVPREKLWNILRERGVDGKIRRIIQKIYDNNTNAVIANNLESDTFKTKEGLRQGGSLSPMLFIVYMDDIIKKCTEKSKKVRVGYINLNAVEISEWAFADDVAIIAGSQEDLQHNILIWNKTLKESGMTINKNKTKVMVVGDEEVDMKIEIEGTEIEQVGTFQYLGVKIDGKGTQEAEINQRLEKATKLYYSMRNKFINKKEISRETKLKVYKAIYRPILTYGCESWVLNRRQKNKIQAAEMRYLRRVRGVTKMDRIKNLEIRKDLKIQSVLENIEERQLGWWGHLHRMENTRQTKRIWEARITKNKRRGRPRTTWDNVITELLERKGKTRTEAKNMTRNRKEWKKFVKS